MASRQKLPVKEVIHPSGERYLSFTPVICSVRRETIIMVSHYIINGPNCSGLGDFPSTAFLHVVTDLTMTQAPINTIPKVNNISKGASNINLFIFINESLSPAKLKINSGKNVPILMISSPNKIETKCFIVTLSI